jgi:hypothetical protein
MRKSKKKHANIKLIKCEWNQQSITAYQHRNYWTNKNPFSTKNIAEISNWNNRWRNYNTYEIWCTKKSYSLLRLTKQVALLDPVVYILRIRCISSIFIFWKVWSAYKVFWTGRPSAIIILACEMMWLTFQKWLSKHYNVHSICTKKSY